MNLDLSVLRAPDKAAPLQRRGEELVGPDGHAYPIVKGIPRFVPPENYAHDFGAQWNRFPKTQLDSHTGVSISKTRLDRCIGGLAHVKGKRILEAGSGAGRFTEILLDHGAILHSLDFSHAVEANAANNGESDMLTLVQADIRHIPFEPASYDYVVCLGVLQHTPDPEESIRCLWKMVRPGGRLVIDHYRWNKGLVLPPPIGGAESLYRKFILKMPPEKRWPAVEKLVNFWFPIHWAVRNIPLSRKIMTRISPVHFYYGELPLRGRQMFYEWALLDTHDGTTDYFKHYRNEGQIGATLAGLGAEDIEVRVDGNGVEALCVKPATATS